MSILICERKQKIFGILHAFICSLILKMNTYANAFCFLFTDALLLTLQLTNIYGNIYTVWMGQTPMVVLNGYKAVKDGIVTHSEETSGRPLTPFYRDMMGEKGVTIPKYAYPFLLVQYKPIQTQFCLLQQKDFPAQHQNKCFCVLQAFF